MLAQWIAAIYLSIHGWPLHSATVTFDYFSQKLTHQLLQSHKFLVCLWIFCFQTKSPYMVAYGTEERTAVG